jgi:amino acid transporter
MQESVTQAATTDQSQEHQPGRGRLGPLLCWAVVFADIGTSVYYTPGILYVTVGKLAGFFVLLTMVVFVLLTLKYAEVSARFPQGGGVVSVAAHALNPWFGALGGMFILVDYFLTAALSCLSGIFYFSVVFPALGPNALWITIAVLTLLGILNWIGITESATVSLIGALIAFVSDLAILVTVFSHISLAEALHLFASMFAGNAVTPVKLLVGFGGAFLAFSGLESISQLSPVMKTPRKKVAGLALLLVVVTIGLTSPLLTTFSTLLQPQEATDPLKNSQLVSLLAGHWGNIWLQSEVAISASALLVFASNTAIIGAYHVFMALSRMEFLPSFVLKRNRLRGTPHYSIALATGVPIVVLLLVHGQLDLLGDMYAFGLLGAFSLTCLGLDVVRWRERHAARNRAAALAELRESQQNGHVSREADLALTAESGLVLNGHHGLQSSRQSTHGEIVESSERSYEGWRGLWYTIDFYLGVVTTFLVTLAWSINLVAKPLATAFGGSVALLGMGVAFYNYRSHRLMGRLPVPVTTIEDHLHGSILAVLTANNPHNEDVIRTALQSADGRPVVFLYVGEPRVARTPRLFEVVDPYLEDEQAKELFGKAESQARRAKISTRRYVYRPYEPGTIARVWQIVHPHDTIVPADEVPRIEDINPDRISYEISPGGGMQVAHMVKRW